MILFLRGQPALSTFRQQALVKPLQALWPVLHTLQAEYVYFAQITPDPTAADQALLARLVDAQPADAPVPPGCMLLVTPRLGTRSPWDSKATDIARQCGLHNLQRLERGMAYYLDAPTEALADSALMSHISHLLPYLHDRMTETVWYNAQTAMEHLLQTPPPRPLNTIAILGLGEMGLAALQQANQQLGLALSTDEMTYLLDYYQHAQRNPTDVELMSFAQANSEHCRHKIFNATWTLDQQPQNLSLFAMIRHTYHQHPQGVLSAYHDNAAILAGYAGEWFMPDEAGVYRATASAMPMIIKVETHNHPTAIAPNPGAATGSGGEIRDEGATGRGSKPKAGLTGFSVSHLHIPQYPEPWELPLVKPERICTALDIMLQAPIGSAAFNNEFGRPNLCGYFRVFEHILPTANGYEHWGYHKPIMIAGGLGNIREEQCKKQPIPPNTPLVVLGGPALLIGLGGGAASSMSSGSSQAELDFASVQRSNPEMQRRCQEVIDRCAALGADNPILSIHDVGAGGLSNALPELVNEGGCGAIFQLRDIPSADPALSPLELWCNEAQERYVMAICPSHWEQFTRICERERCPWAQVGITTAEPHLSLQDSHFQRPALDLPLPILLGKPPQQHRISQTRQLTPTPLNLEKAAADLANTLQTVLRFPTVAAKNFLITIGDRSITGLVVRDQLVGPWQVAVADVAVTANSFTGYAGEAMAMGERSPLALINPAASARMAVGEAITNLLAAPIGHFNDIKLSANWMAAANHPGEDAALFAAVRAIGLELCPQLGIAIPVGKDSLSMQTVWQDPVTQQSHRVTSPLSLIISAFAPLQDVRPTLTPQLQRLQEPTVLILIDLGQGKNRLGGSILAQTQGQCGTEAPDVDQPALLIALFQAIQALNANNANTKKRLLLAYHDRSDGGLWATVCEMAFASRCGLQLDFSAWALTTPLQQLALLCNEELGAVLQIRQADWPAVLAQLQAHGLADHTRIIGRPRFEDGQILIQFGAQPDENMDFRSTRAQLQQVWQQVSYALQALRDNPECAQQEYAQFADDADPGLHTTITFNPDLYTQMMGPYINTGERPRMAILREQGVNGQVEMAAAFDRAGFECVDVHMSDLGSGQIALSAFQGLVACGGFSYGDVLGAGQGWAKSIVFNPRLRDAFAAFFHDPRTFSLGVCNGCQMLSQLRELIPGTDAWPVFMRNRSAQFEARVALVKIQPTASILFQNMAGSVLPIPVAHGEGYAQFSTPNGAQQALQDHLVTLQYVDSYHQVTERYPHNPNGSPLGITGLTSRDGRCNILMPHPERAFRALQNTWQYSSHEQEAGYWLPLFINARRWLG